jgi:hypothetical protein
VTTPLLLHCNTEEDQVTLFLRNSARQAGAAPATLFLCAAASRRLQTLRPPDHRQFLCCRPSLPTRDSTSSHTWSHHRTPCCNAPFTHSLSTFPGTLRQQQHGEHARVTSACGGRRSALTFSSATRTSTRFLRPSRTKGYSFKWPTAQGHVSP